MPEETHTYRDRDGNPCAMSDAWSTVVDRKSEWNDYTRDRVYALMAYEAQQCPGCGNYDTLVPLDKDLKHVTWTQHDGRKIEVRQMRCVACGAADLVKRDAAERHKDDKPATGRAAWADGRMFATRPLTDEEA